MRRSTQNFDSPPSYVGGYGFLKIFISQERFLLHAMAWASDVKRESAPCNFCFSTI
jgi:hypothetical protein